VPFSGWEHAVRQPSGAEGGSLGYGKSLTGLDLCRRFFSAGLRRSLRFALFLDACPVGGHWKNRMERETGIEPATSSLGSWRSTAELLPLESKPANDGRLPLAPAGHNRGPVDLHESGAVEPRSIWTAGGRLSPNAFSATFFSLALSTKLYGILGPPQARSREASQKRSFRTSEVSQK
jgi:hypothetical protein